MHTNEGILRAYLDGELGEQACNSVAAHLRECAACRRQLEMLASRVSAASQHLQALAPHALSAGKAAELPASAPVALARIHSRLANESTRQTTSGGLSAMFQRLFTHKYRAAWVGLASLVVIALLFTLAPVRAAASEFLGQFRVRKFAIVSINPANLQSLEKASGQVDKLLSDSVTFVQKPQAPVAAADATEASKKAGIRVRLPSGLATPTLTVQDGMDMKMKVDLARVQAILDVAGRNDIKLPQVLDGANVEFVVPPMVTAAFGNCPNSADCVMLLQLASPSVDAPKGVNLSQMGEAMLQLLGLSPIEAKHFSKSIDWSSTLVIPVPTDAGSFRDATIDGVPGVIIESRPQYRGSARTRYTLFWEKNDVVYSLSGWDDPLKGIEVANSLK